MPDRLDTLALETTVGPRLWKYGDHEEVEIHVRGEIICVVSVRDLLAPAGDRLLKDVDAVQKEMRRSLREQEDALDRLKTRIENLRRTGSDDA